MIATQIKPLRSLRFWLPMLLLLFAAGGGLCLYVFEMRLREAEFEAAFNRNQMLRAGQLQADVERWVQRNDLEMVQSILAELGTTPELKTALFLDATNSVLAAVRRDEIGRPLDIARLGLANLDARPLNAALQTARQTLHAGSFFTEARNGLIVCFPTSLPLQPGNLEARRGGIVLVAYDLSPGKAANLRSVQTDFSIYFACILAAVLMLAVSLHFLITRRLQRLKAAMGDFAAGKAAVMAASKMPDEIGHLIGRFNEMAAAIQSEMDERLRIDDKLRRLNRELRALSNCNQTLMRATDEMKLLRDVCQIVCDDANYRMAWVGYAETDSARTVRPVAWAGAEDGYLTNANIAWDDSERGRGPTGTAIRTGKSIYVQDFAGSAEIAPWRERALQRGYRSSIALPLKDEGGTPFGALMIYSAEADAFTPDELRLLEDLAGDLSFGITFLRARVERQRNNAVNASRLHLIQFAASHSLDELLEETLNEAEKLTGSQIGFYHFVEEDQVSLTLQNWSTKNKSEFCKAAGKGQHYAISDAGVWGECVARRKPVIHNDYASLPNRKGMAEGHAQVIRELVAPVMRGENVVAILGVGNKPDNYGDNDAETVSLIADLAWEIADRKRVDEALRASEERYRELIQKLHVAVVVHGADTRIVTCNHVAQALLGLSEDQMMGKTAVDPAWHFFRADGMLMLPGEYPANQVLATGEPVRNLTVGVHRPDGTQDVWVLANANPVFEDGRISKIIVSFIDITDLKKSERQLALLSFALNHVQDAAYLIDENGRFLYVNDQACRALGYSRTELLGMGVPDIDPGFPHDHWLQVWNQLKTHRSLTFETNQRGKDGRTVPVEIGAIHFEYSGREYNMALARDITERKRTEEKISHLAAIVESSDDAIIGKELDERIVSWNRGAERIYGYTAAEIVGRSISILVPPGLSDELAAIMERLKRGETIEHLETTRVRKDGRAIHVALTISPIRDARGQIVGASTIARDITERRRTAELLHRREQEFRTLVENSPDIIARYDRDCRRIYVNPAYMKAAGIAREKLLGVSPEQLSPLSAESAKSLQNLIRQVINSGIAGKMDLSMQKADGTPIWFAVQVVPEYDSTGKVSSVMSISRDITERKRTEEALRVTAARLNEAQRIARLGSWELDLRTNVLTWSPEIFAIFEIDPKKFEASYEAFLNAIHPDDRAAVNRAYVNSLQTRAPYMIDHRLLFPDGRIKFVHEQCETFYENDRPVRSMGTVQDITERKRVEREIHQLNAELEQRVQVRTRELAESEERFRTIYETAPVSIWQEDWTEVIHAVEKLRARGVTDFKTFFREHPEFVTRALNAIKILDVNHWTLEMFAARNKAEMLASLGNVFSTPDTLPGFVNELVALAEGQSIFRTEMALNTVQGDQIQTLLAMSFPPAGADSGNVLVSIIDITERKAAEKALQRQAAIIDLSPDAILVRKLEGTILFWSRGAETIYGWTKEEAWGQRSHSLFQTEFLQPLEQINEQILKTGRWSGELVHRAKDGRRVIVQSWWLAQFDEQGRMVEIFESNVDITERKSIEQALRASDERMRLFFQRQLVGTAITSPEKGWLEVNDKLCEMLGYSREELTRLSWAELTYPEDLASDVAQFERLLNGGIEGYTMEKRFVRKDGSIVFTNLGIGCVRRPDRSVNYVLAMLEDITRRKQADEQIRRLNDQLAARALSLEQANKELEAFSYSVSHDLRAPLRSIDGFSRMLLEDYADKLDEEGKENLHTVRAASQRMGHLIDDMLRLSQLNRSQLRRVEVDLTLIVEQVADDLRKAEPARAVEFVIAPDCVVMGDAALMRIALENIVGNSWKYTSKKPRAKIEFGTTETPEGTAYFVRDDGCGFDMKYVHKLFGSFQRLHSPSEFPGTGIGLASVQRVIRRHGGKVWIEGKVGQGATVYFTLPKQKATL